MPDSAAQHSALRLGPTEGVKLRGLSLGAGLQSTTMALMAAHGEITPMPDFGIFVDTQSEPAAVYDHLQWLKSGNVLPFPIYDVTAGSLYEQIVDVQRRGTRNDGRPPLFVKNPDGSRGILNRQCTDDFKIAPIEKKVRELLGLRPRQWWPKTPVVEMWVGISRDEIIRVKPSGRPAIVRRHPLIELGMRRWDCEQWLRRNDYPIPTKSACTFCPYRSNAEWRRLRDTDPEGWAQACEIDRVIRSPEYRTMIGECYLHQSLLPLDQAPIDEPDRLDLWGNDCGGMCGV